MLHILLATTRPEAMRSFTDALLSDSEVHLAYAAAGSEALNGVSASPPHLVIVDSGLPDTEPLELISRLLRVNAMVNTAVVSSLSEAEFHEASEGLGVLGRLPEAPGSQDALDLLKKLRMVVGLPV